MDKNSAFESTGLRSDSWQVAPGTWGSRPLVNLEAEAAAESAERRAFIAEALAGFAADQAMQEKIRVRIETARAAELAQQQTIMARRQEVAETLAGAIAEEALVICQSDLEPALLSAGAAA